MEIFIIQTNDFPHTNSHYVNHKSFSSFKKAVSYCVREMKMKPINFNNKHQFVNEEFQIFKSILNSSRMVRIMKMVIEQ